LPLTEFPKFLYDGARDAPWHYLKGLIMVKLGLLARLEAKPGKEAELSQFLEEALVLASQADYDIAWFAFKIGASTFGIFDVFVDEAGRQSHLNGPIAAQLMARASELLAEAPKIDPIDVIAAKLPY
jgi:quinol monooxygenase YgiN